jgi:hypothetical protein
MKITSSHNTTAEAARAAVEDQVPRLMERFGSSVSDPTWGWRGNVMEFAFTAVGASFRGSLEITDTNVVLEVNVPLSFRLFQGTIEAEARKWCDELFGA